MRMYLLTFQSVLFAIHFTLPGVQSTFRWLSLPTTRQSKLPWRDLCPHNSRGKDKRRLLDRQQKKLVCRSKPEYMKYVVEAAYLTKLQCINHTKYTRWNCEPIDEGPKFPHDFRDGTKESAFIHALSSAALVFSFTRNCFSDKNCKCGKKTSKIKLPSSRKRTTLRRWGSCHDNIERGIGFSEDFLNSGEMKRKKNPVKRMVNFHNYDVGRKAVRDSMKPVCRCHGVTTACSLEFCTLEVPVSFSEIALNLFKMYKKARHVHLEEAIGGEGSVRRLVPKPPKRRRGKKKPKNRKKGKLRPIKGQMIFLDKSRDFCVRHNKRNLTGTEGRECNREIFGKIPDRLEYDRSTMQIEKCDYLCCMRGFGTKREIVPMKCKCKFKLRKMGVECKVCPVPQEVSTCS